MKTVKSLIKSAIAKNQCDLDSHYDVLEILKKVNGKQFNFRTFNKKVLGDRFKFNSERSMFYIIDTLNGQNHLIGYHSSNYIDSAKFYDLDVAYSKGAEERIEKLKKLDIKKVEKMQRLIAKHFNALRDIFGEIELKDLGSYDNPIYYDILNNIYDRDNSRSSRYIKLSDFYFIRTNNKTVEI